MGYEGRKVDALTYILHADSNWCIFSVQFSTAISTCTALTLWYRSIQPNESTVEWLYNEKDGIWWIPYTLNTSIQTYKPRNTAMGCQLGHGWYLNSWLGLKRPKPKWVRSHNQHVHSHWRICIACMMLALIQSSQMAKSDGEPYDMSVSPVFTMHWPYGTNVIACLPLSISHDSSHWGSCQPAVWECWYYSRRA